jgi:hypothetical protein
VLYESQKLERVVVVCDPILGSVCEEEDVYVKAMKTIVLRPSSNNMNIKSVERKMCLPSK